LEIVCSNCGETSNITAKKGNLCYECWKAARNTKRKARQHDALNSCFGYVGARKVSAQEAKIINEVMIELEKSRVSNKNVKKD